MYFARFSLMHPALFILLCVHGRLLVRLRCCLSASAALLRKYIHSVLITGCKNCDFYGKIFIGAFYCIFKGLIMSKTLRGKFFHERHETTMPRFSPVKGESVRPEAHIPCKPLVYSCLTVFRKNSISCCFTMNCNCKNYVRCSLNYV